MSKFKVSMDLDLTQIAPEALMGPEPVPLSVVEDVFTDMLINEARKASRDSYQKLRRDQDMDPDVKAIKMAEHIRKMMLTLMAQANLSVERLDDSTTILTQLPFEKNYDDRYEHRKAA